MIKIVDEHPVFEFPVFSLSRIFSENGVLNEIVKAADVDDEESTYLFCCTQIHSNSGNKMPKKYSRHAVVLDT
jgi:hypothetical protein